MTLLARGRPIAHRLPGATAVVVAVLALALPGCTVYDTPDGHQFRSTDGAVRVRAELGEPDLVEEQEHHMWGPYRATKFVYFGRGYFVRPSDGWVRGVHVLTDDEKTQLERRTAPAATPR